MKLKNFLNMNISNNIDVYVGFVGHDKVYKEINIYNYKDRETDLATILYECEVETYEIIPICANKCNMFIRVNTHPVLLITKEDVKEASEMWENDLCRKLMNEIESGDV